LKELFKKEPKTMEVSDVDDEDKIDLKTNIDKEWPS
jgi:hypothetical protein